jgi:hypothetical protein
MALDIYVMPIWKFKCGDFSSPVERLGLKPKTVGMDGSIGLSQRPGLFDRWRARSAVRRLRGELRGELKQSVRWNEEGGVVYSEQGRGFDALSTYARWLDYRDLIPTFEVPPDGDYDKHPMRPVFQQVRPLTYPHVTCHNFNTGYFIPADFDRVVHVEPFTIAGHWTFHHAVGSSTRLSAECKALGRLLDVDENWPWNPEDPLLWIKAALRQLLTVTRLSREHDLPIIFHG